MNEMPKEDDVGVGKLFMNGRLPLLTLFLTFRT